MGHCLSANFKMVWYFLLRPLMAEARWPIFGLVVIATTTPIYILHDQTPYVLTPKQISEGPKKLAHDGTLRVSMYV
jgi:hypothetical protein